MRKEPSKVVNPDEAVVYGAVQAAILAGDTSEKNQDRLNVAPLSSVSVSRLLNVS